MAGQEGIPGRTGQEEGFEILGISKGPSAVLGFNRSYLPKESTKAQLLEAKANLLRLRHDIPLADAELSAVEDGLAAYEELLSKLADIATPAGPTPRQLRREQLVQLQGGIVTTRTIHQ